MDKNDNIEYQLNEDKNKDDENITIFGKKKNAKKKNYYFLLIFLAFIIICFIFLFFYLIKDKHNQVNKISKEYLLFITSDLNNTFNITFKNYNDYIQINAYYINDSYKEEYETKIYLSDLKYDKFLSLCNTIEDAYDQLIFEINKNTLKLLHEKYDYINIIIPIEYISIKQINLKIPRVIKTENEILSEKIKFLENKIKVKEEEIEFLENQFKVKVISQFNFSSIIKNNLALQFKLIEWIEKKINKNFILQLIFKMSENGFSAKDFHYHCDNKGPTLILIKTKNDENDENYRIIGGFTPLNWESPEVDYKKKFDNLGLTFMFILKPYENIKMDLNREEVAIVNNILYGPCFGDSNCILNENLKKGELKAGEILKKFEVLELEVYKVIY